MSKKIGILTFHSAVNFGAALQCYALQETIKKIGGSPEIIDYVDEWECSKNQTFNFNTAKRLRGKVRMLAINILSFSKTIKRKKAFKSFWTRFNLSSPQALLTKNFATRYSSIIVGSDQVWNCELTNNNFSYFLEWANCGQKIAYAASFGSYSPSGSIANKMNKALGSFSAISVREETGKDILQKIGVRKKITVSLDPTLLLGSSEWAHVASKKIDENKYILVYGIRGKQIVSSAARRLSKETGLNIVNISPSQTVKCGRNASDCGPEEFLAYFKNAQYVLTDSFHGTVFSIIMEKHFLVNITSKKGDKNTRSLNILKELGLRERTLEKGLQGIYRDIDWNDVRGRLGRLRSASIDYLKKNCLK